MAFDHKCKYYSTALVAKLSIFSNLVLRKRIVIKRMPVRGKYVRQLSESFDFHFFFMLWHDVVKFVNLLLQPLRNCCANLICTFFLHIFTKKACQFKLLFFISALWIGKWKICSQSMSQSWKKNPSNERWRISLQNTSGSWIGFQIVGQEPICWYR